MLHQLLSSLKQGFIQYTPLQRPQNLSQHCILNVSSFFCENVIKSNVSSNVSASEAFFDNLTVEQEFMTGVDTDKVFFITDGFCSSQPSSMLSSNL